MTTQAPAPVTARPRERRRLLSLDAFRGLAVVLMVVVDSVDVLGAAPEQLTHARWHGFTVADVVFPLFLLAVGMAMPFSAKAQSPHLVLRRVALLLVIGVALSSLKYGHLVLAGVLQHVAGAYLLGWLVLRVGVRAQVVAVALLLTVQWVAFTVVDAGDVVAGSWARGTTPAAWLDTLVLGAEHTEGVWAMVTGATTVVMGAWAGRLLVAARDGSPVLTPLLAYGATLVVVGLLVAVAVPLNKHLWTPSYALLSGGVGVLVLAGLHALLDARAAPAWSRPLLDLGGNALAVFVVSQVLLVATADLVPSAGHPAVAGAAYAALLLTACWALAAALRRRGVVIAV